MKTWQIIVRLKQLLICFPTAGKSRKKNERKKRTLQQTGADSFLSLAILQLLGLAFVDTVHAGGTIHDCRTAARIPAEVAGR
jgi:hypothetical protein